MPKVTENTLQDRVAVVTGAGTGIGAAIAHKLAQLGAVTLLCGRRRAPLESSAAAITQSGGRAEIAECDVSDLRSVESLAARVERDFSRIDILINNAGVGSFAGPLHLMPPESWERVLNTNLRGVYFCIRSFAPMMIRAKSGHIVNISSLAGKNPLPNGAAYAASKAGVIGFTKSLAKELIGSGVLANCIAPVMTETDLFKEMTQAHIDYCRSLIPMGRFLQIDEIAAMVAWIAGPECSFTTGAVFDLSGGRATY